MLHKFTVVNGGVTTKNKKEYILDKKVLHVKVFYKNHID
jgi:hypothetical protein